MCVSACERDPDSLVEALQPFVTLTGTVGEEEVRARAGQHVSVTCTQTHPQVRGEQPTHRKN